MAPNKKTIPARHHTNQPPPDLTTAISNPSPHSQSLGNTDGRQVDRIWPSSVSHTNQPPAHLTTAISYPLNHGQEPLYDSHLDQCLHAAQFDSRLGDVQQKSTRDLDYQNELDDNNKENSGGSCSVRKRRRRMSNSGESSPARKRRWVMSAPEDQRILQIRHPTNKQV